MANIAYRRIRAEHADEKQAEMDGAVYDMVFTDRAGQKATDRELKKMLAYIRRGDTVTVESYGVLTSVPKELYLIVDTIIRKGAVFISRKENVNTGSAQGKAIQQLFTGMAEFVREMDRAKGKKTGKGRNPIQTEPMLFDLEVKRWKAGKQTARETARNLGLSPATFYRKVREPKPEEER